MFSGLNQSKLSSNSQNAAVLFYRGATVEQMLTRLRQDPKFLALDSKSINKIYIMCGTNDVDKVLQIPISHCSTLINNGCVNQNLNSLNKTFSDFNTMHKFLRDWNPDSVINFINILPRISRCRNLVINQFNNYLKSLSSKSNNTKFVSTESDRHLFVWQSYRRNDFFSSSGTDNVHLNRDGVVRLSKHLKYLAHN